MTFIMTQSGNKVAAHLFFIVCVCVMYLASVGLCSVCVCYMT